VAYVIPFGGVIGNRLTSKLVTRTWTWYWPNRPFLNANKRALGFADLTVGMSELRLAA